MKEGEGGEKVVEFCLDFEHRQVVCFFTPFSAVLFRDGVVLEGGV